MTRTEIVLAALRIKIERVKGRRAWALCPFHNDRSATNFFVRISGERVGQSHCFSCKKGGTLAELVMHVRSCDFNEAKKFIDDLGKGYKAPKARVTVVRRPPQLGRMKFKMPAEVYFEPLDQWVSGARRYATGRCKITDEEVYRFGIGYAVEGRLGGRIILPWRSSRGIPMGYSARTFVDEEPKYLTPNEEEHADHATMFGEHTWSTKRESLVVTEGALNALMVRKAVGDYETDIAALGGSEINPLQVIKLATFKRVVILTDSDPAGDTAATQLATMLNRYTDTLRLRLPDKKDALDVGRDHLRTVLVPVLQELGVTLAYSTS